MHVDTRDAFSINLVSLFNDIDVNDIAVVFVGDVLIVFVDVDVVFVNDISSVNVDDVVLSIVFVVDVDVVLGIDVLVVCVDETFGDIVIVFMLVDVVEVVHVFVDDSSSMLTLSSIS